jgi:hypothetical protein
MPDHYEMIKRARAVLLATPKRQVRDSTAADYLFRVKQLRARGEHHGGRLFDGAIAERLGRRRSRAGKRRGLHCARGGLEGYPTH